MLTRRLLIGAAAMMAAGAAQSQDWKSKYPELVFAVVPAENASGVTERWTPFATYLSKELGVPVKLRIANDYAAVIEGQRSGNIQLAQYGPASYARAYISGVKTTPFAIEVNDDGTKGYHSVLWVKKDSPYQSIQDLKGKNLCLVDPNSTSGNNVPRFAMNKMGIDPDKFFSKVVYAGSHENAVIGVQQGTCDAAFNWWNNETESNLARMDRKSMVKAADFRKIFESDLIVNSPFAYVESLPENLKQAIRTAVLEMPKKDPEAFNKLYEGKMKPWEPVEHQAYEPVIELVKFVDTLRKKSGS